MALWEVINSSVVIGLLFIISISIALLVCAGVVVWSCWKYSISHPDVFGDSNEEDHLERRLKLAIDNWDTSLLDLSCPTEIISLSLEEAKVLKRYGDIEVYKIRWKRRMGKQRIKFEQREIKPLPLTKKECTIFMELENKIDYLINNKMKGNVFVRLNTLSGKDAVKEKSNKHAKRIIRKRLDKELMRMAKKGKFGKELKGRKKDKDKEEEVRKGLLTNIDDKEEEEEEEEDYYDDNILNKFHDISNRQVIAYLSGCMMALKVNSGEMALQQMFVQSDRIRQDLSCLIEYHEHRMKSTHKLLNFNNNKEEAVSQPLMMSIMNEDEEDIESPLPIIEEIENNMNKKKGKEHIDEFENNKKDDEYKDDEEIEIYERPSLIGGNTLRSDIFPGCILVRRWMNIRPHMVFRAFVFNNVLTAMTQYYYHLHFELISTRSNAIEKAVKRFIHKNDVINKLPIQSCILDLIIQTSPDIVVLLDINPFHQSVDACLFNWFSDFSILSNGPFEFRYTKSSYASAARELMPRRWKKHIKSWQKRRGLEIKIRKELKEEEEEEEEEEEDDDENSDNDDESSDDNSSDISNEEDDDDDEDEREIQQFL